MKKFENKLTQDKFLLWIRNYPESHNGYDMDRFYDFVLSLKQNEEWISEDELRSTFKEEKEWEEDFRNKIVGDYYRKLLDLGNFIDFIIEKNLIKKSL